MHVSTVFNSLILTFDLNHYCLHGDCQATTQSRHPLVYDFCGIYFCQTVWGIVEMYGNVAKPELVDAFLHICLSILQTPCDDRSNGRTFLECDGTTNWHQEQNFLGTIRQEDTKK